VTETGQRREDRQKWMLEAWRDAIAVGRYAGVRYDCTTGAARTLIARLATKVALSRQQFGAYVQPRADEIAALPDAEPDRDEQPPASEQQTATSAMPEPKPAPDPVKSRTPEPAEIPRRPEREVATTAAERMQHYRDVFEMDEAKWRRRCRP
jgi:hypothetical protein